MPPLILVMIGGAIGAAARFQLSAVLLRAAGPALPWGTFATNLIGGLLMGLLAGILGRMSAGGESLRLLLGVGVLGGFTTFSAFSLEAWLMIERGQALLAAGYALASIMGAVAMLFVGLQIARAVA